VKEKKAMSLKGGKTTNYTLALRQVKKDQREKTQCGKEDPVKFLEREEGSTT